MKIKVVDAYNTPQGSSTRKLHKKGNCVGYVITIEGKTIYHAGDTDFIPEMKELGKIDVALLPIGGKFTMDIEEAVKIDRLHGSKQTRSIQNVDIPEITLPVGPGRNLAVLLEAAVRNHILNIKGYDASQAFIERQKRRLESAHK